MRAKLQKLARAEDIDVEAVIEAAYGSLAQAPCRVVIATLEDALRVERRPNIPGTTFERPNWSMSLPRTIEELEEDRLAGAIVRTLSRRRSAAGRRGSRG
jgi:4-alpha-glucanotransferase